MGEGGSRLFQRMKEGGDKGVEAWSPFEHWAVWVRLSRERLFFLSLLLSPLLFFQIRLAIGAVSRIVPLPPPPSAPATTGLLSHSSSLFSSHPIHFIRHIWQPLLWHIGPFHPLAPWSCCHGYSSFSRSTSVGYPYISTLQHLLSYMDSRPWRIRPNGLWLVSFFSFFLFASTLFFFLPLSSFPGVSSPFYFRQKRKEKKFLNSLW